jgi:phospholipase/carboxylesterase
MHGGHRFIDPIGLIALVLALLLVVASPSDAQADAAAAASPAGGELVRLPDEAFAFIPASVRQGRPAPLVVLLHGAGGRPADMIAPFRAEAEREGIVLVAPASRADSWDMIVGLREDSETARRTRAATGTAPRLVDDPPRVRAAMAEIGRRVAIDPRRVALAGFSDGASYALTLGPLNPRVFPVILAFSPGMAFLPKEYAGRQRVFVAHGRQDRILPFRHASGNIVPDLRRTGLAVTFRPFDGGHQLPAAIRREAFTFLLASPAPAPDRRS